MLSKSYIIVVSVVLVVLVLCDFIASEPGNANDLGVKITSLSSMGRCPRSCSCTTNTIDCAHRGLTQVPRNMLLDIERL